MSSPVNPCVLRGKELRVQLGRSLSQIKQNVSLGKLSGSSSAVERQLPKLDVTGSIPVSRSNNPTTYLSMLTSRTARILHP